MSATTISLEQWIEDFRREVGALEIRRVVPKGCMRPSRAEILRNSSASCASCRIRSPTNRIWEEEKRKSAKDLDYQPRYFREARS
jgi:hypothetical protein